MHVTLIEAANALQPTYEIFATGGNYVDINWNGFEPILEADLNAKILDMCKAEKIEELSNACELAITAGFQSSALGDAHIYDSEAVDQINLIGAVAATEPTPASPDGYNIYYACRNVSDGTKEYHEHTHAQLRQVLADGAQVKLGNLQTFFVKKMAVLACTTLAEVEAITW